jgi:drug/metabolite transporter (DMT)-like permease
VWGAGDFGGGLVSRRAPVFGVVLVAQIVGMILSVVIAVAARETLPPAADLGWSVGAGLVGAVGITALYRGLAVGRMGVVAPVTGVIAALIPVSAGILLEGLPAPIVLVGILLAILAVILVSRVSDDREGPSGLGLAILAGVSIGAFTLCLAQMSDGHPFGQLAAIRATETTAITLLILAGRSAWRPDRRLVPAIVGIGILDLAGNTAFLVAIQSGALAVATVLSSLYPVATVLLASVFLHERVTRSHAAGIALAAAAIACIAAGTAG